MEEIEGGVLIHVYPIITCHIALITELALNQIVYSVI